MNEVCVRENSRKQDRDARKRRLDRPVKGKPGCSASDGPLDTEFKSGRRRPWAEVYIRIPFVPRTVQVSWARELLALYDEAGV